MPLGIHIHPICLSLECQEVPVNIAAVGREITSSSSFPGTGTICHSQKRQVSAQTHGAGSHKTWEQMPQAEIRKGIFKEM